MGIVSDIIITLLCILVLLNWLWINYKWIKSRRNRGENDVNRE